MKKLFCTLLALCLLLVSCSAAEDVSEASSAAETSKAPDTSSISDISSDEISEPGEFASLSEAELEDRILGSWVGQMVGVVYGADLEYHYQGEIIPLNEIPDYSTLNINDALWQDDLYVEITFLNEMLKSGWDCSLDRLGAAFAASEYTLDHANKQGRENLRAGIKAGLSGSYLYNTHCDDIDWQIDSDFIGSVCPGLPQTAAERSFEIGHLMNYGDGVYGGVFVAAMHAKSFVTDELSEVIQAGFDSIPDGTLFKNTINGVRRLYDEGKSWEECWRYLEDNCANTDRCLGGYSIPFNIDAKLNAGYVLIGLLWGEGDFDKSMVISQQCGQDSDCNPSTVGGVLGNLYGFKAIPDRFKQGLVLDGGDFSYCEKNLKEVVADSLSLAKEVLAKNGISASEDGVFTIPKGNSVSPVEFEQWPDVPTLTLSARVNASSVALAYSVCSGVGIASYSFDMGDGSVFEQPLAAYSYSAPGKYTIKCRATDRKGDSAYAEVEVDIKTAADLRGDVGTERNISGFCAVIASDTAPTGGGSKDINVIRDGKKTFGATMQYDTYIGYCAKHTDYIGYLFGGEFAVSKVVYTEGIHYDNGGWFADGTMALEALIDGVWQATEVPCSPIYPNGNTTAAFGAPLEVYTFELPELVCSGIRLSGRAGGDAGFINCTELEVFAVECD